MESILDLLSAEGGDRMFTGDYGHYMPFTERKKIRERNTFAPDDPSAMGKCGSDRKNCITTERATFFRWRNIGCLINLPFYPVWTDPALYTGMIFLSIL
jgi:hypothetical protein